MCIIDVAILCYVFEKKHLFSGKHLSFSRILIFSKYNFFTSQVFLFEDFKFLRVKDLVSIIQLTL